MALDGRHDNLGPEAAAWVKVLEKKIKALEAQIAKLTTTKKGTR